MVADDEPVGGGQARGEGHLDVASDEGGLDAADAVEGGVPQHDGELDLAAGDAAVLGDGGGGADVGVGDDAAGADDGGTDDARAADLGAASMRTRPMISLASST